MSTPGVGGGRMSDTPSLAQQFGALQREAVRDSLRTVLIRLAADAERQRLLNERLSLSLEELALEFDCAFRLSVRYGTSGFTERQRLRLLALNAELRRVGTDFCLHREDFVNSDSWARVRSLARKARDELGWGDPAQQFLALIA
jgi:hypothetical protein